MHSYWHNEIVESKWRRGLSCGMRASQDCRTCRVVGPPCPKANGMMQERACQRVSGGDGYESFVNVRRIGMSDPRVYHT